MHCVIMYNNIYTHIITTLFRIYFDPDDIIVIKLLIFWCLLVVLFIFYKFVYILFFISITINYNNNRTLPTLYVFNYN